MTRETKLVQLRSRTDRDLLILIQRELDRGLTLADVATTKASPLYAQAERVYRTVKALQTGIVGWNGDEQRELERKLRELQVALEILPTRQVLRSSAAQVGTEK